MGRKAEPGISFYQMECDHINNKKVKLLINDHDADGYLIWQFILSYAYKNKGYFFDLNDPDELLLFAKDDCKKDLSLVKNVIECCLNRGLFNKAVYQLSNVLTCARMQENYLFATSERRRKGTVIELIKEFILIQIPEDSRNISIVPYNNPVVPGINLIVPGNNPNETKPEKVKPTDDESKLKDLKHQYASITKDKPSIIHFIQAMNPSFIEPYVDIWNIWATERNKPIITIITDKRRTHFNARIREKEFNFLDILKKAKDSKFLLESAWFTYDWITKSRDNYVKTLEGHYDQKEAQKSNELPVNPAEAKMEKLLAEQ